MHTNEADIGVAGTPETAPELEYAVHCAWADAHGMKQLIRKAHPDEIDAVRDEAIEAANMILALFEVRQ